MRFLFLWVIVVCGVFTTTACIRLDIAGFVRILNVNFVSVHL